MSQAGGSDPTSVFLARLAEAQPDIRGTARIDMTDLDRADWRALRRTAEAHGWRFAGSDREFGYVYWNLARAGTTVVRSEDPYFVTGPSLVELREYPEARAEAERVRHELGVDPLSDAALEEAKTKHLTFWRSGVRWGGLGSVSVLCLLVLVLAGWQPLIAGGTTSAVLAAIVAVLGAATVVGWVVAARKLSARKTAVRAYTEGYERVVSSVLHQPRSPDEV